MVMAKIHETAVISPSAEIGDAEIAEYVIIRGEVKIGDGVYIGPHTIIEGKTTIGEGTKILFSASIGLPPQDIKYRGEPTEVIIGKNNIIREFVTIHRGTAGGGGITKIGDNNLLMAYVHIAHDCQIGNGVILANAVNMGGHTVIEDEAIIGGLVGIHQFVHIGRLAMVGAASMVLQDVLPFALVSGNPAKVHDINRIGLRRRNFPSHIIDAIHKTVVYITRRGLSLEEALSKIRSEKLDKYDEVKHILRFVENRSCRGILRGETV